MNVVSLKIHILMKKTTKIAAVLLLLPWSLQAVELHWAAEPVTSLAKGETMEVSLLVKSNKTLKWNHVNGHFCPIKKGPKCAKDDGRIDGPAMKGFIRDSGEMVQTQEVTFPEDTPYGQYYLIGHGFLNGKNVFTEERVVKYGP